MENEQRVYVLLSEYQLGEYFSPKIVSIHKCELGAKIAKATVELEEDANRYDYFIEDYPLNKL